MGLPEINIEFSRLAATVTDRSSQGIVACIILDDTEGCPAFSAVSALDEINHEKMKESNYTYLKMIFAGNPGKVLVFTVPENTSNFAVILKKMSAYKWHYLTIPALQESAAAEVSAYIKEMRDKYQKPFKVVLSNQAADHEGIINLTAGNIKTSYKNDCTTQEYTARIAGILAGLSVARSCTGYVLDDVISCDMPEDPDKAIDDGELIFVFDSEVYKIGRGVNSLKTFTVEKPSDLSKIKIVECMDFYRSDIKKIFADEYTGKVRNSYDNKQAFVAAIAQYHKDVTGTVLDDDYNCTVGISIPAQRAYLSSRGVDVSSMDDTAIAHANTGSMVFIAADVRFVDAMEDLHMIVTM